MALAAALAAIALTACGRSGDTSPGREDGGPAVRPEESPRLPPVPPPAPPEAKPTRTAPTAAESPPPAGEAEPADPPALGPAFHVPLGDSPWKGASEPLAVLVEFIDFACPHSARMAPVLDRLVAAHPDDLRVVVKAYPIPGHGKAPEAAAAAAAAHAQGRFWELHDRLFANPAEWTTEDLERLASEAGLDLPRFRNALEDRTVQDDVATEVTLGHRLGVTGTPSFALNGRRFEGSTSFRNLERLVTRAIAEGRAQLETGVPRRDVYEALTAGAPAEVP
ncbi:MAG: thioredoxin domain-containing protein [Deltaproteobacteria bacterium]|nr:thioredoxin domain-containing protein [Deltaproteobacteria bacterium]